MRVPSVVASILRQFSWVVWRYEVVSWRRTRWWWVVVSALRVIAAKLEGLRWSKNGLRGEELVVVGEGDGDKEPAKN